MKKIAWVCTAIGVFLFTGGCTANDARNQADRTSVKQEMPTRVNFNTKDAVPRITAIKKSDQRNTAGDRSTLMRLGSREAKKVKSLKEIKKAFVIVTDNNAFVGVKLEDKDNQLTSKLSRKIWERIKEEDRFLEYVYISSNPEFFSRMEWTAKNLQSGKPAENFPRPFADAVRKEFPNAR